MKRVGRIAISPIFIGFLVAGLCSACGGGGGVTAVAPATKTITVELKDVLGNAVAKVLVQLDQSGATAITDASGVATLTGAATGAHDIHMFPAAGSGFQWESIYQTTTSAVHWQMSKNATSYVEFSGSITNLAAGSTLHLLLEDATTGQGFDNDHHPCIVTGATYTCSLTASGIPIGSSGNFNLWALESVNGDVTDGKKLQDKGTYTVTTTAQGGAAVTQNVTLHAVKPPVSNLITINTVTPPAGVTVQYRMGFMPLPFHALIGLSGAFGSPIIAYNPFPAGSNVWAVVDDQTPGGVRTWIRLTKSTPGATLAAATSSFTSLPAIVAQNAGGVVNYSITFAPAHGTFFAHSLEIKNSAATKTLWNISIPPSITSVTLPTIPSTVTPVLTTGVAYKMQLTDAKIGNVTFEQAVAGKYDPTLSSYSDVELVLSSTVAFTR